MTRPIEKTSISDWLNATGGIVGVLFLVQFITGVLLAFYYVPSVDHAHTTVSYVEKVVSSGAWLRALHHYGSQWLSLFVFLHVIRLFLNRAYVSNRVQWIVAMVIHCPGTHERSSVHVSLRA